MFYSKLVLVFYEIKFGLLFFFLIIFTCYLQFHVPVRNIGNDAEAIPDFLVICELELLRYSCGGGQRKKSPD